MSQLTLKQAFQLAVQRHQAGDLPQAEKLYRQILAQDPAHANALHNLGAIALQCRQNDVAVLFIRQAIALHPNFPEAHNNLGNALRKKGQLVDAIAAYRQAIALRPAFPEAHYNLANVLREKGDLDDAISHFRRAIVLNPQYVDAYGELGNALMDKRQIVEAIAVYRQTIALKPDFAQIHSNLGNALKDSGDLDQAIAAHRQAIALAPNLPEAHRNLALALLMQGSLPEGWKEYEWRWRCPDFAVFRRNFPQRQWKGNHLTTRTLLLHSEQGFGDTIQFIRYLPLVVERCRNVIVLCQPELQRLLRGKMGDAQWITPGGPLPSFDFHCPLMSLPGIFGTTLQSIPSSVPYVQADAEKIEGWRERLSHERAELNVGLVWAGRSTHNNDRNRSLPDAGMAALGRVHDVKFVSLQKAVSPMQPVSSPEGIEFADWTQDLKDFSDTAALIANLDLVITVDTAVGHLAGAMGKAVWVLLPFIPDWRWMRDREDSPWYPTMRLFRQKAIGDWKEVIARVADALAELSVANVSTTASHS